LPKTDAPKGDFLPFNQVIISTRTGTSYREQEKEPAEVTGASGNEILT